ncbi:hypothetical protein GBA52_012227 [Prunus armeniaca]|nr:hypothetical protein GBA52_012227 [Prunus armeniaca]
MSGIFLTHVLLQDWYGESRYEGCVGDSNAWKRLTKPWQGLIDHILQHINSVILQDVSLPADVAGSYN